MAYLRSMIYLILVLVHFVSCDHDDADVIDLTYSFDENSLFFPGHEPFVHEIIHRGPYGPLWYESNRFRTGEHTGTHMDAPAHLKEGKLRLDDVPVGHLVGAGVKIDISLKASVDPDTFVNVDDLVDWEKENGHIPNGAILMVYSNWGRFYHNRTAYFGSDKNDTFQDEQGNSLLHFPGVSPDAADWLISNRNIVGIGIDTASADNGQSTSFITHVKLFEQNIYILENVANLENMPTSGSTIYALPMKIKDGSGSPTRIIAIVDNRTNGALASYYGHLFLLIGYMVVVMLYN